MNTINTFRQTLSNKISLSIATLSLIACLACKENTKQTEAKDILSSHNQSHFTAKDNSIEKTSNDTYTIQDHSQQPEQVINTINILDNHITTTNHNGLTTITIDAAYTKTLGITGEYICHLIQDTHDKNYYVFESNIDELVVDNTLLTTYLQKNDGFEDLITLVKEKNPDIDAHIAESILSMNIKDQSYNPVTQAVFNYIYTTGEKNTYNKIIISDIYKPYISLSTEEMYDKLLDEMSKLENEEISELQGKVIEKKLNTLAPYAMIERNH